MGVLQGLFDGLKPTERITPSDWADKYRLLSSAAAAEPGRWRTARTPYLQEIMDALSPFSELKEIAIMKGAQLGFTEAGFNAMGYSIHIDPCPIMYVMPTLDTVRKNVKQRINPMIAGTPELAAKISAPKSKDSGNSIFQKDFPGGTLILAGANSASSLRSVPIKVLILDEVDAYPKDLDNEGSPVDLAKARTRTFAKKKIMLFSTPLIHGNSVIESAFLESSQRRFFIPCPKCNHYQHLVFEQLKYQKNKENEPIDVHYECEKCEHKINEYEKNKFLALGEWRDTVPKKIKRTKRAYHINSLYSPLGWYSWVELLSDWIKAQGKPLLLQTFMNTVLGETWMIKGEVPDWENLYNRRIDYPTNVPNNNVCLITAGVDVQKDRLELEIVGWGKDNISYSIDYRLLPGDTSDIKVWNELAKVVGETWTREDNIVIPLYKMAVDTGYNTAEVYNFCRRFTGQQVIPVKGQDKLAVIFSQPRAVDQKKKRKHSTAGLNLYNIGVSILKQEFYGRLKLKIEEGNVPPGYCFFPKQYDEFYFKMLTAEQLSKKIINGYNRYFWEKIRERNEALDCRVYARAAASISGVDRMQAEHWDNLVNTYVVKTVETKRPTKRKDSIW